MDDYGKQMGNALQAVLQMQGDSVKLLRDLERQLNGLKTLVGNYVTLDLGSSISRQTFMAEGLLRHYSRDGLWGAVLGLNICFYDFAKPSRLPEPIFIAARLRYTNASPTPVDKQKRPWDPWYAFLEWSSDHTFRTPITLKAPLKSQELDSITMAAAPLFSINSLEAALEVVDLVGGRQL